MSALLQSDVVIVARTRLGLSSACIGALTLDGKSSLRLFDEKGFPYSSDARFAPGQTWTIQYRRRPELHPPHVEDVHVQHLNKRSQLQALRDFLLAHVQPWRGSLSGLFGGCLRPTANGHWYCCASVGFPPGSVGFWISDLPLDKVAHERKVYYRYGDGNLSDDGELPYVGFAPEVETIAQGSLLRVSLARAWQPPHTPEPRCYLQLSGWYE